MADIVIFGARDTASLAHWYLRTDSDHRVVGFTVHREYLPEGGTFEGLPIVPFEELETHFPPDAVKAFAPMTHRRMNALRKAIFLDLKARRYEFISYVSSRATHFSNSPVGDNCLVLEDATIQPFSSIGSNVVLWSGVHVGHHSVVHDHAFLAPRVVLSGHCTVGQQAFLGIGAIVRDQVTVAEGTLVGMGAVVTRDTQPWSVYKGDATRPARVTSTELDF